MTSAILHMPVKDVPFGEVVPYHDNGRGDDLGEHIPYAHDVDEEPHDRLVNAKAHDGGQRKEGHLFPGLLLGVENHIHAEDIVHHQGHGKGNGRRYQRVQAAVFGECIKEEIFQKKAASSYGQKSENLPEPVCGGEEFSNERIKHGLPF